MEISEYHNIYKSENSHFYYLATHKLILTIIQNNLKNTKNAKILDAGCGTGLLAKKMVKFGQVVGVDINPEAIYFSNRRGIKVVKASLNKLPFKKNQFDLIVCIDVIYHQQIVDKKALNQLFRILKPGGLLILRVPAYNWLRRSSDKQVHTRERYSYPILHSRLTAAGFNIEKISFIHIPLLLLAIIQKVWERIFQFNCPTSPILKINPFLNRLFLILLLLEIKLVQWVNLPFGLGILAVVRK